MKRKVFVGVMLLALCAVSVGASKPNDELKRMGIFISNFTEQSMYNFDMKADGYDDMTHLGNPDEAEALRLFGLIHNVINNPKSTVKTCPNKKCPYGKNIMSGKAVAASVRKYFDVSVKNRSIDEVQDDIFEAHYDGKDYHFNAARLRENYEEVYYADVQEVSRRKGVITMSGELYNLHDKKDRPATFTATAKPHKWDGKDTWAILSLNVDWK